LAAGIGANKTIQPVFPCGYGGGGRFTALAIDPQDARIILVGSDVAGVFKSTDGGDSFEVKGQGLEGFSVAAIVFHPDDSHKVYLLTDDGLYESIDHAESWHKLSPLVFYRARFIGSRPMVFFENDLWTATDANGVFQLKLDAPRLPMVLPVPGLITCKVNSLAVYHGSLYAGTSRGVYQYKGEKWHLMNAGLPPGNRDITDIIAHTQDRLYIVDKNSGLHIWNAAAEKWEKRGMQCVTALSDAPKAYKALAVHPDNPDRIFLATHPETWPFLLFQSDNGGASWETVKNFTQATQSAVSWRKPVDAIETILFSPQNPDHMYLSEWWNVWRSLDGGKNWTQLLKGLQNSVVNDIKVHLKNKDTLFTAVADNGLVMSDDAGKNWKRIMSGVEDGHGQEVELSRQNPLKMYLLMNPWFKKGKLYIYKTLDGGTSWQDVGFSTKGLVLQKLAFADGVPTNLEIDPADDDIVYVGTNGYGIFKTVNGGRDWEAINNGLASPYIKGPGALLTHPRKPQTLFASTQGGGIYKTTDGGRLWKPVTKRNLFTFGMAIDPSEPSRIIAGCAQKKYILSEDEGMTWQELQLPGNAPPHIAAYAPAFNPVRPQEIFMGTLAYDYKAADGLFVSHDRGRTFKKLPLDLPGISINDIAVSGSSDARILLGFNGIGMFCAHAD
jgi:photosystem II stability/assembly factor-like uncharacterized protein